MATVTLDLVDGASVVSGPNGDVQNRVGRVSGLAVAPHLLFSAALSEPGVPQRGDALDPTLPWIVCFNITGRIVADDAVELVFQYGNRTERDAYDISIPPINNNGVATRSTSWTTITRLVSEDIHGFGQDFTLQPPAVHAGEPSQVAQVEIEEYICLFTYRRAELDSPTDRAQLYVGKVNSASIDGKPARSLKCVQYSSDTTSNGRWFDVVAEFAFRPLGWDETHVWRRADGRDPGGHDANSRKVLKHLEEISFAALNLDFS